MKLFLAKDINVPIESTKKIFGAASNPKQFIAIENMNHFYKNEPKITKVITNHITKFFVSNL